MRRFYLDRLVDPLGISGTGKVAEGVEFGDGQVHMQWIAGPVRSIVSYRTMADCQRITCAPQQHSEIVYLDAEEEARPGWCRHIDAHGMRCQAAAVRRFRVPISGGEEATIDMCAQHEAEFGRIPVSYRVEELVPGTASGSVPGIQEATYEHELVMRCPYCRYAFEDTPMPAGMIYTCPECGCDVRMPKRGGDRN